MLPRTAPGLSGCAAKLYAMMVEVNDKLPKDWTFDADWINARAWELTAPPPPPIRDPSGTPPVGDSGPVSDPEGRRGRAPVNGCEDGKYGIVGCPRNR